MTKRDDDEDGARELTSSSYVASSGRKRHFVFSSSRTAVLACCVWICTLVGESFPSLARLRWVVVLLLVWMFLRRVRLLALVGISCLAGIVGGASAWNVPVTLSTTECSGVAVLRSDPQPQFSGTRVVLDLDGQRYIAQSYGGPGRRLVQRSAGESVVIRGTCSPLQGNFVRADRVRHIVGRLSVEYVSESFGEGNAVLRAANRMRTSMNDGVAPMSRDTRSLFMGLVVGDDRLQPRDMVQRFRNSGLSHLCAASGQNVAYLLALASPVLKRRSPRLRWLITLCIIGWFVVLTRGEPSVLRAGWMAAAVATNAMRRTPMNARTVLSLSVVCLLLIDPMLAWSIGFALSVGATAGLAWLSAPFGRIVGGRGVLASTLAAQVGTVPVSLAVFGSVPVVSLVTNPLALPVAGAVMTVGLPLSLLASTIPPLQGVVSAGLSVPVVWVDTVARLGSALSPHGALNTALWAVVVMWVALRWNRVHRLTSVAG